MSDVTLSFPNLELLDLSITIYSLVHFHGDMTQLRKAIIKIHTLAEGCASVFGDILRSITNVEELELHIEHGRKKRKEKKDEYPFHPFVDTVEAKDLPTFPNLKRLKLSMCFHELSIEDLVFLLHSTPMLQSLQLVHVKALT